ncbi:alpha-amylase [Phlyctema vagabunda]|uniref:alpha-amylase n=1 Tax=Phlyctema vagabunda TaxID=108571 RepID=A0ABR4PDR8_9HELO
MKYSLPCALALLANTAFALSPAEWRSQSIYQVVTDRFAHTDGSTTAPCDMVKQSYCGGTWRGIINKLDYIQSMGFTAIWLSPVTEQVTGESLDGSSYHGYWQKNIYKLNKPYGTEEDLKALSDALHERGMYLMLDIVTNHMAWLGNQTSVDYSTFTPFNNASYFHPPCFINYDNKTSVQECWIGSNNVALPDLRTELPIVRKIFSKWIKDLIKTYNIDGLRLDTTPQLDEGFLDVFQEAADTHILGEIFNGDPAYICPFQEHLTGILNYGSFFWIRQAFESTKGSISNLVKGVSTIQTACRDVTVMGTFSENHDNDRFPNLTPDFSLAKNSIAFTILSDGIPIIYYGQEQHMTDYGYGRSPLWRTGYDTSAELYGFITAVNRIRHTAIEADHDYVTTLSEATYSDNSTIVLRKGSTGAQVVGIYSNLGLNSTKHVLSLGKDVTGFKSREHVVDLLSCNEYTSSLNGTIEVTIQDGLPVVLFPSSGLSRAGADDFCGGESVYGKPIAASVKVDANVHLKRHLSHRSSRRSHA